MPRAPDEQNMRPASGGSCARVRRGRSVADARLARVIRWLAVLMIAVSGQPAVLACNCFSLEMRLKAAEDTMRDARLAVVARVLEVAPDGQTRLLVLEAFKGATKAAEIEATPDAQECPDRRAEAGQEVLVLAFKEAVTLCGVYPSGHFLIEALRAWRTR